MRIFLSSCALGRDFYMTQRTRAESPQPPVLWKKKKHLKTAAYIFGQKNLQSSAHIFGESLLFQPTTSKISFRRLSSNVKLPSSQFS